MEVVRLNEGEVAWVTLEGHYTVSLSQEFRSRYCTGPRSLYAETCRRWELHNWTVKVGPSGGIPGPSGGHDTALGTSWRFRSASGSQSWNPVVGPGVIEVRRKGTPERFDGGVRWYDIQEGVAVRVRRKGKPKLVLECKEGSEGGVYQQGSVSVQRGSSVTCRVRAEPTGRVSVSGWEFKDDLTGRKIEGPAGETEWGGTMVVGGTLTVKAVLNGTEEEKSAAVVVRARDWTGKIQYPDQPEPEYVVEEDILYPPLVPGASEIPEGALGFFAPARPYPDGTWGLGSGPNDGWYFLDKPPVFTGVPRIVLNPALRPHDPFYRAQVGSTAVIGTRKCGPADMASLAEWTLDHEVGHYIVDKRFYSSKETADLLEGAAAYEEEPTDTFEEVERRRDQLQDQYQRSEEGRKVACEFYTPSR